jgi:hypothetical protein
MAILSAMKSRFGFLCLGMIFPENRFPLFPIMP